MFALVVGVVPAGIAGVQKPWMALGFHILVTWIRLRGLTAPAIHAGMTVLIYFQILTFHERLPSPRQMKDRCRADKAIAASACDWHGSQQAGESPAIAL
jgi:hypothetical protein